MIVSEESKPTQKQYYACGLIWKRLNEKTNPPAEYWYFLNDLTKESASKYISENIELYEQIKAELKESRKRRKFLSWRIHNDYLRSIRRSYDYEGYEEDCYDHCTYSAWYE